MTNSTNLTFNKKGWQEIAKHVVETEGVRRMKRVADAANAADDLDEGYLVSTEGDDPLSKADYRATVITATAEAMRSNAKRNTLVRELHRAGGD
jgi:hypothetical protein